MTNKNNVIRELGRIHNRKWITIFTVCITVGFYPNVSCVQQIRSNKLYIYLVKSQIGCHIDNVCVNHVMYADDICLMTPSPTTLQKLLNI